MAILVLKAARGSFSRVVFVFNRRKVKRRQEGGLQSSVLRSFCFQVYLLPKSKAEHCRGLYGGKIENPPGGVADRETRGAVA